MEKLTLHPSLVLGYPPIDDGHQLLVDIVNDFIEAPDDETLKECRQRTKYFIDETSKHLKKEITILSDLGYPDSEEHKKSHNHIQKGLKGLLEQVEKKQCLGFHKVDFINNIIWVFLEDAMREDLKAKSFLLKIGVAKDQRYKDFFKWDSSVEVGVPTIDEDHRNILLWLDHLHDVGSSGMPEHIMGNVLNMLVDFIVLHFRREEQAMEAASYPDIKAHKQIHQDFENKVLDIQRRFTDGDSGVIDEEVMVFIKEWLVDHILNVDRLMAPHIQDNPTAIAAADKITIEKLKDPFKAAC